MEQTQTANEVYYLKQIIELKNDIIKLQKELLEKDKIMKQDKERIEELEKKLNEIKAKQGLIHPRLITTSGSFNILEKEPIFKIPHSSYSIYILQDGRLAATCGNEIRIYNSETFKSEMTIKEHNDSSVYYITQLSNGLLISVDNKGYINIYSLLEDSKYLLLQKIYAHSEGIYKLREYDNDRFMTCSADSSIKFYFKNKNEYFLDYTFQDGENDKENWQYCRIYNMLKTKEDEIAYMHYQSDCKKGYYYYYLKFYDLKQRKIIDSSSISAFRTSVNDSLYMVKKKYLLVGVENNILLFDINQRRKIRSINSDNSGCILTFMQINDNTILSGDANGKIRQWIIDEDNLIHENKKENADNSEIQMIRKRSDGLVISVSNSIKGWA